MWACAENTGERSAARGLYFSCSCLKFGGGSARSLQCLLKPPASLIKSLITDAAYFIAGGKEFSFSELCLFFGVAGVIMMRSFLFCFLFLEEFFLKGRSTVLRTQFHSS